MNCLNSFSTKNKLEWHKNAYENKEFCNAILSSEYTNILEFNQYQKSDKARFVIYANLECLIEKNDGCKNNPEKLSTKIVSEHMPSGFSMSTISPFRGTENKRDVYRGKDCMKKFCESLSEKAMKVINFKKKKMKLLIKKPQ